VTRSHRTFLALVSACVMLMLTRIAPAAAAPDVVNVAVNPDVIDNLPIFIAADRGYFTQQNLDVRITKIPGSSLSQLPSLARGSIDIAPMALGPAFFNQFTAGFDVKLVASLSGSHPGWNDGTWVMVRQDLWDAGKVRKLSDLKGRIIDGYVPGAPPNMLIKQTLAKAGMTTSDVIYSERMKSAADALVSYMNKAVEVTPAFEPMATQLDRQHLAHKWLSVHDVIPDYQGSFLAASSAFVQSHRDVVKRFLVAILRAQRDIDRSSGKWTPMILSEVAKWSEQPEATIAQIPGPSYSGDDGSINQASVERQQAFWVTQGLVKTPVAVGTTMDASMLEDARKQFRTERL
jgi:NitT/TauT family transport system substrate-binding protein